MAEGLTVIHGLILIRVEYLQERNMVRAHVKKPFAILNGLILHFL